MLLHRCAIGDLGRKRGEAGYLKQLAAELESADQELAGIVALRTGHSRAIAWQWMEDSTTFNAGTALAAGLVHAVEEEDVPAVPRAVRAKFAPINGPYQSKIRDHRSRAFIPGERAVRPTSASWPPCPGPGGVLRGQGWR
jgi:hypothetical protein